MGRPFRKGLHYFNIDCDQDDNLNFIEARHGIVGYGVVVKLWRKIYMLQGYYCEWAEKNIYLFAREVNVNVATVNNIVETCFTEDLFCRKRFEQFRILTSRGIQRRYTKIVTEAKRKDSEIDPKYLLLEFLPEKQGIPPEAITTIPELSTQIKGNEIIEKELKEKRIVAASPAPKKVSLDGKAEEREPHWPQLVEVWMRFGKEKFGVLPGFVRDDPKIFKRIIQRLRKRAEDRNISWSVESSVRRLTLFLESTFSDKWLSANFLLSNLEKQFDKFIQRQGSNNPGNPAPASLEYLYERFCVGNLDQRMVLPKHYEELHEKSLTEINDRIIHIRMKGLVGSNIFSETQLFMDYEAGRASKLVEEDRKVLMKLAVIEYFKSYQLANSPAKCI